MPSPFVPQLVPAPARPFLAYLADFGPEDWLELPTVADTPTPGPLAPGGFVAALARRDSAFRGLYGGYLEMRAIEDAVSTMASRVRQQLLAVSTTPPLRTVAEAEVLCQWAGTALVVRHVLGPAYFPLLYRVDARIPLVLVDPEYAPALEPPDASDSPPPGD